MGNSRWFNKTLLLSAAVLSLAAEPAFSDVHSRPGDAAEFAFTVKCPADSQGPLENPHIVYEDKPWWFTMGGKLSIDDVAPGQSREMVLEYTIADNAPPGTYALDFRVEFDNTNIFPPYWLPFEGEKFIIDAVPGAKTRATRPPAAAGKPARRTKALKWPDINYGNKCHSLKLFPGKELLQDVVTAGGGVKIRFKMFANEPEPCRDGEGCRMLDCEAFRGATGQDIPCVSKNSKVFISPCEFKAPAYPPNLVSADPEIASLNSKVREKAVAFADLTSRTGLAAAYSALSDPSPDVRLMAVLRLDELDGARAAPALCAAAKDKNTGVAYYAVKALGVISSTATAGCLREALRSPDAGVRKEAAFWIGAHHCGKSRAGSLPEEICGEAASLNEGGGLNRSVSYKAPYKKVLPYVEALQAEQRPGTEKQRISRLNAKYDALSPGAKLSICNNRAAVEPLIDALEDGDAAVVWGAAKALGHYDDPRSIAPLVNGLNSPDEQMRMHSAISLAPVLEHIKDYSAFSSLMSLAKDPTRSTQAAAVKALGKLRAEDAADLLAGLAIKFNDDERVNAEAVTALAAVQSERAKDLLVSVFDRHETKTECLSALALKEEYYWTRLSPESRQSVSAVISGSGCARGD